MQCRQAEQTTIRRHHHLGAVSTHTDTLTCCDNHHLGAGSTDTDTLTRCDMWHHVSQHSRSTASKPLNNMDDTHRRLKQGGPLIVDNNWREPPLPTLSRSLLASESEIPTAISSYLHSSVHSVLEGRKLRGVRWPRGRTFRSKWVTILLAYVK